MKNKYNSFMFLNKGDDLKQYLPFTALEIRAI